MQYENYGEKIPLYKNSKANIEDRISDLLNRMTLEEKARQLDQYFGAKFMSKTHPAHKTVMADDACIDWDKVANEIGELGAGCFHDLYGTAETNNELQKYFKENTRLGIPLLCSEEALHGLGRPGCTVFPQQISLACTWDTEIAWQVGRCIATETRSFGIHETFGPVIDLTRDPRWGRIEETYGEDTYLSSKIAVAMIKGLQGDDIAAQDSIISEPKHFAAYGAPTGGLNCAPAQIGARDLVTYYLPVFESAVVEGGALNIMCSYNSIDGVPCANDYNLLTEILRNQWGMPGIVRADLGAILRLYDAHRTADVKSEAIRQAIEAGVDMQYYDFPHEFYQKSIINMVKEGIIKEQTINLAVSRVLRIKFRLGLFDNPYTDPELSKLVVRSEKHQNAALEAARAGICLLKNEGNLLPLKKDIAKIAVIGPNADRVCLGDYTPHIEGFKPITLLNGIKGAVSHNTKVNYVKGVEIYLNEKSTLSERAIQEAIEAATNSDIAIVALGDSDETCGEGLDRAELNLPGQQLNLLKAIHATGTPVILVLQNGRPISLCWEAENIPAIIEAWYPGEKGGQAISDVIFGYYNPSGRLPVSFPKSVGQIPVHYNRLPGGSRKYVEHDYEPLFHFGHGLSYTKFSYENLSISPEEISCDGEIRVVFDVVNVGTISGHEVAQVYLCDKNASVVRPIKELRRFSRVFLEPGERQRVSFSLGYKDLRLLNRDFQWVVEPGKFDVMVGSSSEDIRAKKSFVAT